MNDASRLSLGSFLSFQILQHRNFHAAFAKKTSRHRKERFSLFPIPFFSFFLYCPYFISLSSSNTFIYFLIKVDLWYKPRITLIHFIRPSCKSRFLFFFSLYACLSFAFPLGAIISLQLEQRNCKMIACRTYAKQIMQHIFLNTHMLHRFI